MSFDHVTSCSRLDALFDQLLVGVGGDHEHADVGVGNGEAPACFGAAQARQAHVEEYDVGPRLVYQLGELLGGAALADNLEIGLGLKDRLYAFADDLVIVDDENPDHGCRIGSGMLTLTTSPAFFTIGDREAAAAVDHHLPNVAEPKMQVAVLEGAKNELMDSHAIILDGDIELVGL